MNTYTVPGRVSGMIMAYNNQRLLAQSMPLHGIKLSDRNVTIL
jgi:hypothetical protein